MTDYEFWDGRYLTASSGYIAFDTETEVLDDPTGIPRLVLMTATDGDRTVVVNPNQVELFVLAHSEAEWVGFNVAFDFWVIHNHLSSRSEGWAASVLMEAASADRFHDLMLLDTLVRLADPKRRDQNAWARNLAEVAADYTPYRLDKEDPYRKRYGEIIGADLRTVEPGFLDYAVMDVVATYAAYAPLVDKANKLAVRYATPDIQNGAYARYGTLTAGLQTKAAIALAQIGRNGLALDVTKIDAIAERLQAEMMAEIAWLKERYPQILSPYKQKAFIAKYGDLKLTKSGQPRLQLGVVRQVLTSIATERRLKPPRTEKTREIQASLPVWRDLAPDHPFVEHWIRLSDVAKVRQFVVKLKGKTSVHPRYVPLVRTGRTSCREPNIQQMPREPWFRELFVARPGHRLIVADYSAIELRTLAAVFLVRFGASKLAEVFQKGIDPHIYTAAMVNGQSYDEFQALAVTDPKKAKSDRQKAKVINFGVPGGLGAPALVSYAKLNYGVVMTLAEAKELRDALIYDVYPELGEYLSDDSMAALATGLGTSSARVWNAIAPAGDRPEWLPIVVQKIVRGRPHKKDGTPYNEDFVDRIWSGLRKVSRTEDEEVKGALFSHQGDEQMYRRLFDRRVATLTGRIRAGADYGESRNTPFQGLAADGAKVALWRLLMAGYKVVAFVHDEVVVESPEERVEEAVKDVSRIMIESMEEVLWKLIPVEVKVETSSSWEKP